MKIVSRLREVWHRLRRKKKPVDGIVFEEARGRVDLLVADDFLVRFELFKEFKDSGSWGFELSAINKAAEPCKEAVIAFNRKKGVRFTDVPADGLRIKSVEFAREDMAANTMLVEVIWLTGKGKEKASFVVPLNVVFEKLRETGKLKIIEGTRRAEEEIERQKQAWKAQDQAAASVRRPEEAEPRMKEAGDLELRYKELEEQKQNLAKSFMKRELAYNEYATVMGSISKEMVEIRTKLERMKKA